MGIQPQRKSTARSQYVQCKTCWDCNETSTVHPLDYLKNALAKMMNSERNQNNDMVKMPCPSMTVAPTQLMALIHYYPIKDGKMVTNSPVSFFTKKQTILTSPENKIAMTNAQETAIFWPHQAEDFKLHFPSSMTVADA